MSIPTDHPLASILADYQAGRLIPVEVVAVSDHLAGCASCRETLLGLERRVRAAEPIETPAIDEPATYAELAALLDGELNAEQSASLRARLVAAPGYTDDLADLETFRQEMAALPPRTHGPTSVGEKTPFLNEPAPPAPGKILPFPRRPWMVPLAAAAAVLLLLAGWWTLSNTRNHQDQPLWMTDGRTADLAALPTELRQSVEQSARTGALDQPSLPAALRPPPGVLAGPATPAAMFKQLAPVGIIVRDTHPRLRWTPREGATGYVVYLVPASAPDSVLRQDLPASQTEWTSSEPLKQGTLYEWQVEARSDGATIDRAPKPPAPEARFQVLDADTTAKLDKVEQLYGAYPLILGTAYARAGLTQEAAGQFQKLSRQHPDSEVAKRLEREATKANPAGT